MRGLRDIAGHVGIRSSRLINAGPRFTGTARKDVDDGCPVHAVTVEEDHAVTVEEDKLNGVPTAAWWAA